MARCSYCGRNSMRYEEYPFIETVQVTQERVSPPSGVRDLGITRNITHTTFVLAGWSLQICRSCGGVWEEESGTLYSRRFWISIDPSIYQSYRQRWYDTVRRHRLNLRPHIHK